MMRKELLVACISILAMLGCTTQPSQISGERMFTREDFKETKRMANPEEIVIEDLLYPSSFRVLRDSLLVASNQPVCEYGLEIYSLNTLKPLVQLARKGGGPEDMMTCSAILYTNTSPEFYLNDGQSSRVNKVHLDTMLTTHRMKPLESFRYSADAHVGTFICPWDEEHYVANHMWYLNEEYSNGLSSPFLLAKKNEISGKTISDYKHMVGSVNGSHLFKHPTNGQLWAMDMHNDVIRFYNDSLRQVGSLKGPDHFQLEYEGVNSNAPMSFISFTGGKSYRAYSDYFTTDKHIYLVYEGCERFDMRALPSVEVFKMDLEGNLLCRYEFDRYVYSISVDSAEEYLYCASRSTVMEPPVILRYEL